MKENRVAYKEEAKRIMNGRYQNVILYLLITGVITSVISYIGESFNPQVEAGVVVDPGNPGLAFLFSIILFLIGSAFAYSMANVFIDVVDGAEIDVVEKVKIGFVNEYGRNIILTFVMNIFIFLWALLLIIPGIIKAYAYSMSFYIANKEPGLDAMACISKSKEYTKGYKADLFVLDLSYLGWYILGIFTLGILWLWIVPKHMSARTLYFNEIYEGSPSFVLPKEEPKDESLF
jgi:uncharacterized membrane protein